MYVLLLLLLLLSCYAIVVVCFGGLRENQLQGSFMPQSLLSRSVECCTVRPPSVSIHRKWNASLQTLWVQCYKGHIQYVYCNMFMFSWELHPLIDTFSSTHGVSELPVSRVNVCTSWSVMHMSCLKMANCLLAHTYLQLHNDIPKARVAVLVFCNTKQDHSFHVKVTHNWLSVYWAYTPF